jgi:preprotein translocase subunit Sec61beta
MTNSQQSKLLAVNILRVFDGASSAAREEGARWYPGARSLFEEIAAQIKVAPDSLVGAAAAISPGVAWHLVPGYVVRLARRERVSIPTYCMLNVQKARRILKGASPLDVLSGPKVRAFYSCIMGLDPDAVCVDGHAVRIARAERGTIRGEGSSGAHVTPYQYALVADAYRLAAGAAEVPVTTMQATTWVAWRGREDRNLSLGV